MQGPVQIGQEDLDRLGTGLRRRQILSHFERSGLAVQRADSGDIYLLRDAAGRTAQAAFRPDGTVQTRTASGRTTSYRFDAEGTLVSCTDPGGLVVTSALDSRTGERVVTRQGHGEFRVRQDPFGLPERVVYPDNSTVRFDQKRRGGEAVVDEAGHATLVERDDNGEIVAITNRNGGRVEMREVPAAEQRVLHVTQPDGTRSAYMLGPGGDLREWWLNGARAGSYAAGDGPLPSRAEFHDGHWVRFESKDGRIVVAENPHSRLALAYDGAGRLVEEDQNGIKVRYERDPTGLLTAIVLPDGERVGFGYDEDGRLARVRDWAGEVTTLSWAANGQIAGIAHPNGVATQVTSNPLGLATDDVTISSKTGQTVCALAYRHDARDRVVAAVEGGAERRYSYDPVGRLVGVASSEPDLAEAWTLDPMGNRTAENGAPVTADAMNRASGGAAGAVRYDGYGRAVELRTPRGLARLAYNGQGQLIRAETPSGIAEYAYDGLGRRIWKRVGGRLTRYLWAGQSLLCEWIEGGAGGWKRRDHLFLPDLFVPLAMRVDGRVYRQHTDQRGAPVSMTDAAGAVVWKARLKAFGEATIAQASVDNPWRLANQYHDDETGLHYNLTRYFHPGMGRFLSLDPAFDPSGGGNYYLYAAGDPINRADPTGEILPLIIGGAIIGAAIGAAVAVYQTRGEPWDGNRWKAIGKAALVGGVVGAVGGLVFGGVAAGLAAAGTAMGYAMGGLAATLGINAIAGAVSGAVSTCAEAALYDREVSGTDIAIGAGLGALLGVAFAGGKMLWARSSKKMMDAAVKQTAKGLVDEAHVAELAANGIKFTPDALLSTGRNSAGQVVFLESGNARAGLQHIVEQHGADFAKIGVPEAEIPGVVMRAVTEGKVVGYQGRDQGRAIYEIMLNGQNQRIAVSVGDNGFIVGANPAGRVP